MTRCYSIAVGPTRGTAALLAKRLVGRARSKGGADAMGGRMPNQGPSCVAIWGGFRTALAQRQLLRCFPGNTPENHPPAEGCTINSKGPPKQHGVQNSGPWGPWQASDLKKKNPWCTSRAGVGCRIQDLGIRGYRWCKTADFSHSAGTARAQRGHSARCAPIYVSPCA